MTMPFDEPPGRGPAFNPQGFSSADYLHEAGHAVVALSLGVSVEGISRNEGGMWQCHLGPYDGHPKQHVGLIAVAGHVAELRYSSQINDPMEWAQRFTPWIAEVETQSEGEPDFVEFYCAWECIGTGSWQAFLLDCCQRIWQLFASHPGLDAAVLAIAEQLYHEESLTGDQVKALYDSHGDGSEVFGEHE